jgi:hypothetical protein
LKGRQGLQRLLIAAAAVGAFMHVATLFPTAAALLRAVAAETRPVILAVSATLVIAILACALAVFLVVRAGARYEARTLALFLVLVAVCWGSVLRFASLDYGPDGSPTGLDVTVSGSALMMAVWSLALASAALLQLSLRFPRDLADTGAAPSWLIRRPWVPWAVATAMPLLFEPGLSWILRGFRALGGGDETAAGLFLWVLASAAVVAALVILGMLGLAVAFFIRGYRRADAEARRSALWLLVGVAGSAMLILASVLLMALDTALPVTPGLLSRHAPFVILFAPLLMVVCVGVAILYSGALDPRLALRRSTINGIAGTVGLLVFAGLENSLSAWVEGRLGLPGTIGSFLAGAASAGVFLPVQHALRRRSPKITAR